MVVKVGQTHRLTDLIATSALCVPVLSVRENTEALPRCGVAED